MLPLTKKQYKNIHQGARSQITDPENLLKKLGFQGGKKSKRVEAISTSLSESRHS